MPIQVTPAGAVLRFLSRGGSLLDLDDENGTVDFPVPTGVKFGGVAMPVTVADMTKVHAVTATADELNALAGAGVTAADAVKLHAVTATAAQLNTLAGASSGIASVLAGGLGAAASYVKTDTGTKTLLAAHATKARACLVVVRIDEVFATGDTSQLILKVGETSTIEKCAAAASFTNAALGAVFVFAFTNLATKAVLVTLTAAAGTGTGAATVTVIAIPTT